MNDGSSKTLMVDERQTVREVLDNLFEKTHCDCNVDWSLRETNHELQLGESPRRGEVGRLLNSPVSVHSGRKRQKRRTSVRI